MLAVSDEHLYLWVLSVQNEDIFLGVDGRTQDQHLLPAVYADESAIIQIARLHRML